MIVAIIILALAVLALGWFLRATRRDLARERRDRQALATSVYRLDQRLHAIETRDAYGGPLSSAQPRVPRAPPPPSESGLRHRATIGAPPEDETVVMEVRR